MRVVMVMSLTTVVWSRWDGEINPELASRTRLLIPDIASVIVEFGWIARLQPDYSKVRRLRVPAAVSDSGNA